MVIYTDIKPLIVAGIVLVLINSSDGHPLPHQRKAQDSGSYGRLTMLKKSCIDLLGNIGVCMFKWDCISQKGVTLSTCVDGFLFGACCSLKEETQEKYTFDSYFKSSTDGDYEKSNTISLIKYVTLSYLQQKTKPSINQEEVLENSSSPANWSEVSTISRDDVTTEYLDIRDTSSKFFFNDSATKSITSSENELDVSTDNYTSSNYSYLNHETLEVSSSDINEEENISMLKIILESSLSKLEQDLNANYSSGDIEKFEDLNNLKNFTSENAYEESLSISDVLNKNNQTSITNELYEPKERITVIFTTYNSTERDFSDETSTYETKIEEIANTDSFEMVNKDLEFRNKIKSSTSVNSAENYIDQQDSIKRNISLSTPIEVEIFTTKEIAPPVWDDYTSLFPSSFQALISQLTSREVSNAGTSVLPTAESNLTSNFLNLKKPEYSESHLRNNLNDTAGISNIQESEYIQSTHYGQKNTMPAVPNEEMESQETSKFVPSTDQSYLINMNSTISVSSYQTYSNNLENRSSNLITTMIYNSPNTNNESLTISINENNKVVPSAIFLEPDLKHTTKSLDLLNTTQEELHVPCTEENELKMGNCTTNATNSNNAQSNKLYVSSGSIVIDKETEDSASSFTKYTYTPDLNTQSGNQNSELNEMLTTISLNSGTEYSYTEDIHIKKNSVNISNSADEIYNIELTNNETADIDTSLDQTTLVPSSFINEEFLFDITTEVLTYFTKSEDTIPDFSEQYEPNMVLTTNEGKENFAFEITDENLFTPSQITTKQIYANSRENTTLINETMYSSSSKNSISLSTESYAEKLISIPAFDYETFMTDYNTQNSLDVESTKKDFVSTKNSINLQFTTDKQYQGNNIYETSQLEDLNSHLNTYSSHDIITPQSQDHEYHVTNFPYETESKYSFYEDYQPGSTYIQDLSSVALNLWQNITNINSEATTDPSVNMSIAIPTEIISSMNTSYNHSNHHTVFTPSNVYVDIFNYTESNTLAVSSTFPIHNSSSIVNYSTISASVSNLSSVTSENLSTILKTTQSETSDTPFLNNVWNYKKDCGVRPMQPIGRIVGGRNTYFGKWPWQALVKEATWLGLFVKNKCGGVLITSKYVLTAAHCQPGFLASLLVVLGTHDISNLKENGAPVIRNVKRMVVHRHYNPQTFENDLALLEMDAELEFLPHVVPICLPHRYEDFTGEMAFVTGWGKLTHGGDVPNILQEVQVPIVANSECQMMFYQAGHHKAIQNNFVCAGYTNGGQDSCEGDSGGPLMVQRKDRRWVLVGTVSHGIGCADPNLPGVYMRMSSYKPWIDSIINK